MASVTPTVVPGDGYVRVEANFQDFAHCRRAWLYRTVAGVDTVLRDGDLAWLSNGITVAFDHEAPLDTVVTYKATSPLNWNGDFESGVSEWLDTTNGGTVGTVVQSLDFYFAGNASLKLTPTSGSTAKAVSEFIPATVGTSYTLTGMMMMSAAWAGGIQVQIQWFNGTTPVSTSASTADLTPAPGSWASYSVTATAPATTTQCKIAVAITGTPPSTISLYADEVYLSTAAATVTSAGLEVLSGGSGWWTDPLHPATKVRLQVDLYVTGCNGPAGVAYLGVGEESFPADSTAMEVNDAVYPVGAFQRRKSGRQAMRVGTATLADLARVQDLHASGAPLLLALSSVYGEAAAYQLHGDLTTPRVHGDQAVPWRIAQSEFVKVLPPVGPAEGTLRTRYGDLAKYTTFSAATAAGATWLDAVRGNLAA